MAKKTPKDEPKTEIPDEPKVDILRGRMPLVMVHVIRFSEDGTDSELAAKYRTTPGKINDIKKSANFGYIVEGTKFSQEDLDKAKVRAGDLGDHAAAVTELIEYMDVATAEELAAADVARKGSRKPRGKKGEGDTVAGEGDTVAGEGDTVAGEGVDLDSLIE